MSLNKAIFCGKVHKDGVVSGNGRFRLPVKGGTQGTTQNRFRLGQFVT